MNIERLLLYAIIGRTPGCDLMEQVESALKGGVTLLQLREKELSPTEYIAEARKVKALCKRYGVPLMINDDVDVAIASGADGVHVGAEDTPVVEIRKRVGGDLIIGATAKTVQMAQAAERGGADYLGVGALFPSPTKKNAVRITKEVLKEICSSVSIPVVAIGGLNEENMGELKGCGMKGFALVSAIFGAEDVEGAAARLKARALSLME